MKKIAFIFPGQGSQYVGMGKKLFERFSLVKDIFAEANEILGFNLENLCFQGNPVELTKTENAQPAILTVSYASYESFVQEYGITPLYAAGHSLGEISALTCAGAVKFTDALKLVRQRGKLMQGAVSPELGAMAAVIGLDEKTVEQKCDEYSNEEEMAVISNYNSRTQVVISGHKSAVDRVADSLKEMGATVVPLKVSAPFHSPLMQPAAEQFEKELKKYEFNEMKWQVISNVNGLPYQGKDQIISSLKTQIIQPVQWEASMDYLSDKGVELFIEMGPRTVLRDLIRQNRSGRLSLSCDDENDSKQLMDFCNKSDIDKATKMKVLTRCMAIAVCTRNQNWDNEQYHKGVVESYKKIEKIVAELESCDKEPTLEQMREALEMLRTVFLTKFTSIEEQRERFQQIFDETGTRELISDFVMP